MNKIKILAIVGKSGAGKDYILKCLKMCPIDKINYIVSSTTRPPREDEVDGVHYHFLQHDDFIKLMEEDKIVEMSVFNDWCYGTTIDSLDVDKINIGCFDPMRLDILSDDRGIDLKIVYITATDKERLIRQLTRENSPDVDEILRRYFADNDDFKYLDLDHDIYEIPNHDGEADQVCQKILDIVEHWDNLD